VAIINKFNQHVDVAARVKVVAQRRAKQPQLADSMPLAELGDLVIRERDFAFA